MKKVTLALAILLIVSPLSAQLIQKPVPDARAPVVGDVNGDGLTDVIDDYTVQINTGGALAGPVRLPIAGRVLDVLDVNGDGAADLLTTADAVYAMPPQGPYFLYINDGHGNFTKFVAPSAVNAPAVNGAVILPPLIADFDGDGKDDLILPYVHGFYDPTHDFRFLRSRGDGSFEETDFVTIRPTAGTMPLGVQGRQHVAAGDINGDGKADVILSTDSSLVILAGRGDGKFEPLPERYISGKYGWGNGMHVVDIDGDGKNDLVWAATTGQVTVFFGDGRGGFPRMATVQAGDPTASVSAPVSMTVAPIHFSSAQRYDVAVGVRGSLVVVLSYTNGALREVARTKLFDPVVEPAYAPPNVWYRDVNVFAGKFRAGSTVDLYAFNSWDEPMAKPAFLLFQEKAPANTPPLRRRTAGKPGTAPALADSFTLHVVPGYVDLITGRCYGQEETLSFHRDGIFATGTRSNGAPVYALIESDDVIHVGVLGFDPFTGGTFTRVAPGHYRGNSSWKTSCTGQSFQLDLDAFLQ